MRRSTARLAGRQRLSRWQSAEGFIHRCPPRPAPKPSDRLVQHQSFGSLISARRAQAAAALSPDRCRPALCYCAPFSWGGKTHRLVSSRTAALSSLSLQRARGGRRYWCCATLAGHERRPPSGDSASPVAHDGYALSPAGRPATKPNRRRWEFTDRRDGVQGSRRSAAAIWSPSNRTHLCPRAVESTQSETPSHSRHTRTSRFASASKAVRSCHRPPISSTALSRCGLGGAVPK